MTPRKPALELVRAGNPGHRSKAELKRGVRLGPKAPPEPNWLERFPPVRGNPRLTALSKRCREIAHRTWNAIVPVLDGVGLLSMVDAEAILDYCTCAARLDQLERRISAEGPIDDTGRRNPAAILARGYRDRFRDLERQLGLTPLARDALRAAWREDEDDPDPDDILD